MGLRMVWTAMLFALVAAVEDPHLLTYGRPHSQLPTGLALYSSTGGFSPTQMADGRLEALPVVRGHLLGNLYAVVYGDFNWVDLMTSSNIFLVDLVPPYQGRVEALSPALWGSGVYAATWHEMDVSFFAVGWFNGLDISIDKSVMGVARCYISGTAGCYPVDQGLPNVPRPAPIPNLIWVSDSLYVAWKTLAPGSGEGSVTMIAQWTEDDSWVYKALPDVDSGDAPLFVDKELLVAGGNVWLVFGSNQLGSLSTLVCNSGISAPVTRTTVASVLWGTAYDVINSRGCWYSVADGPYLFKSSHAAATRNYVYRLSDGNSSTLSDGEVSVVQLSLASPFALLPQSVNYNLPPALLKLEDLFLVAAGDRLFLSSEKGGAIWYLDEAVGAVWKLAKPSLCPLGECRVRNLVPSLDGMTLSWLPPLPVHQPTPMLKNGSITLWPVEAPTNPVAQVHWENLYKATELYQMCIASEQVLFLGDFSSILFDVHRLQAPTSVVWDLSAGTWHNTPLPVAEYRNAATCTSSTEKDPAVWVLMSVGHSAQSGFSMIIARFVSGTWTTWTPQAGRLSSHYVPLAGVQGPSVQGGTLYMPALLLRNNDSLPSLDSQLVLLAFDIPSEARGSSLPTQSWYISANVSSSWAGTMKGSIFWEDSIWLFGSFVASVNGTWQRNVICVNLTQQVAVPVPGAHSSDGSPDSSVIETMAVADPLGGSAAADDPGTLLWGAGVFFQVPGLDDTNNFAAMASNGTWVYSTAKLNGPPSYAGIASMITDPTRSLLVLVSQVDLYESGMILFQEGKFYPPQLFTGWISNVNQVQLISLVDVDAPWLLWLFGVLTLAVVTATASSIFLLWKMDHRRAFKYIEIPDYASHGVRTNMDAILRDVDVTKLEASDVQLGHIIGQGGQAQVMSATYRGQDVAAKAVFGYSADVFSAFAKEIKLTSSVKHPNIVSFIGTVLKDDRMWLITELMDADLASIADQLDPYSKMTVTQDVAKAMEYLHNFIPPVLHRDLKASNVLISRDGRVKLADFGVSRLMSGSSGSMQGQMTKDAGTLLYMAPEMWEANAVYGTPADVYSFGLLVVECWTGKNPFHPYEFTWILDFVERVRNKEVVPGINKMPEYTPDEVRDVAIQCLNWDAAARPAFRRICKVLNKGSLMDNMAGTSSRLARAAQTVIAGSIDLVVPETAPSPEETVALTSLAGRMRDPESGVAIQDRRWYVKTYAACFVGSEAVDWLMVNEGFTDRAQATLRGLQMQAAGLLAHVTRDHAFKDGMFFYRFTIDELERSGGGSFSSGRLSRSGTPQVHKSSSTERLLGPQREDSWVASTPTSTSVALETSPRTPAGETSPRSLVPVGAPRSATTLPKSSILAPSKDKEELN